MVYFTCNNCGASLKKNTVEKHYNGCRRPIALTCVDCLKDFFGQDYVAHTSCLTEDEKYSAKGFKSRPPSNKGEKKQEAWVEMVHQVCETTHDLPDPELHLLSSLCSQNNIPQKKQKFMNFVKSFNKRLSGPVADRVYDLLESTYKALKEKESATLASVAEEKKEVKAAEMEEQDEKCESVNTDVLLSKKERKEKRKKEKYEAELKSAEQILNGEDSEEIADAPAENGTKKISKKKKKRDEVITDEQPAHTESKKKSKKRLREAEGIEIDVLVSKTKKSKIQKPIEEENGEQEALKNTAPDTSEEVNGKLALKFDWSDTICKVLEASQDKELSVKRLRKKVIAEYETVTGVNHEIDVKVLAKFSKRLSKTPGVVLLKDKARLKC